ncbi:hypothetical protein BH11ACT8_BH11ACT8_21240 [soil metagenome]
MSENMPPPPPGGTPPPPPPPPPGGYGGPPGGYGGQPGGYGGPPAPQGWSVGDAVNYGWLKFQANAVQILIAGAIVFVGIVIFEIIGLVIRGAITSDPKCTFTNNGNFSCTDGSGFFVGLFATMIMTFLFYVVYQVIGAGIIRGALNITEGRAFVAADVFKFDKVGPIIITALLVSAAIAIGTLLCFLPGIAAAFFLAYAMYFVIDKDLPPVEALTASFNLVKDNLGEVIVWFLVSLVITFVGALLLGVGLIVAIPVVLIGNAFVYKKLTGQPVAA